VQHIYPKSGSFLPFDRLHKMPYTLHEFARPAYPRPWPPVPAFGQQVDAFLLHPFGDSNKSIEIGV
jgi:hypothetical protein